MQFDFFLMLKQSELIFTFFDMYIFDGKRHFTREHNKHTITPKWTQVNCPVHVDFILKKPCVKNIYKYNSLSLSLFIHTYTHTHI